MNGVKFQLKPFSILEWWGKNWDLSKCDQAMLHVWLAVKRALANQNVAPYGRGGATGTQHNLEGDSNHLTRVDSTAHEPVCETLSLLDILCFTANVSITAHVYTTIFLTFTKFPDLKIKIPWLLRYSPLKKFQSIVPTISSMELLKGNVFSRMHTASLETVHVSVSVATTRCHSWQFWGNPKWTSLNRSMSPVITTTRCH